MSPSSRGVRLLCVSLMFGCGSASSPPDAAPVDATIDVAAEHVVADAAVDVVEAGLDVTAACAVSPGSAWAVWPIVAPAARQYGTTAPDVVVDGETHLTWQKQAAPQPLAWEDAKSYCACLSLGGHDDWRLPSRMELLSIVDYTRAEPSIDPAVFPATPDTWFWTSSEVASNAGEVWYLSFMDGNTHEASTDVLYGVRCVRGNVSPRPAYQIGDGVVTDPATRLVWQRTVEATMRTWSEAHAYCAGLALAGGGWRLPTMYELQTLIDESTTAPAIDGNAFPDTPAEGFWADTPLAGMAAYWFVSFDHGIAYNAVAEHPYHARCVR